MPDCDKCKGTTLAGMPCKRKTCKYAPFCSSHTKVEVKRSGIAGAGQGLFAKVDLKKGEVVADYLKGEELTPAEFALRYPTDGPTRPTHVAKLKGLYYDARDVRRTVAGALNRGGRAPNTNNCKLVKSGKVKVTRKSGVKAGKELFMAYGSGYTIVPH